MKWFFSEKHRLHDANLEVWAGHPSPSTEVAARADTIAELLRGDASFAEASPHSHEIGPITAIHDPRMVAWLATAWEETRPFSETREIIPDTIRHVSLVEGLGEQPESMNSPLGRLGYWCFDTMTPIVEGTYEAALSAVDVALSALDELDAVGEATYALCRPPGHHAGRAMIGGFCFFNNAAIVANEMISRGTKRVGVLDVDVHHGNGTQQIFYQRSDVVYASLHGDPDRFFPYFTGWTHETGSGDGEGFNRNIPLATGCGDDEYLASLDETLDYLDDCGVEQLVVSLGVDTYALDPLSDLAISRHAFYQMGSAIAARDLPLVVVQEGGYDQADLAYNVQSFLRGIAQLDPKPEPEERDPSSLSKQHL